MTTNDRQMNNLQVGKVFGKNVGSSVSSTGIDAVVINDTIKVYNSTDLNTTNVSIGLRDKIGMTNFNNLYSSGNDLYFGVPDSESVLITGDNIISEVNNAFYPTGTSNLTVSNISILGQTPDNPDDYGHINFVSNGSVAIRYDPDSGEIQAKSGNNDTFTNIKGIDADITSAADNQVIQYNSSTSKWENETNMTMAGYITMGSNDIRLSDNSGGLADGSGNKFVAFLTDTTPVNYFRVNNADTTVSPILETVGGDDNVGMTLKSKGTGDILLDATNGDTMITTSNISLNASTNVDLNGYISSSVYSVPTGSWTSGSGNAISLSITTDIVVLNMTGKSDGVYFINIGTGINGQHLHIIYSRDDNSNVDVHVQFASNTLYTGGGYATKIKFTQTGQSASLVYITESINVWAIKNTGAEIDDENVGSLGGVRNSTITTINSGLSTSDSSPATLSLDSNILLINLDGQSNDNYYFSLSASSISGEHMNIVFNRGTSSTSTARVDFGADGLISGAGYVRYITFTSNGQSMSVVYIAEGIGKWQVLNTGGTLS